jgi:hypothetical protein
MIPNVAEKNILILVEGKQIIWFRVFAYNLMWNSEKTIRALLDMLIIFSEYICLMGYQP